MWVRRKRERKEEVSDRTKEVMGQKKEQHERERERFFEL